MKRGKQIYIGILLAAAILLDTASSVRAAGTGIPTVGDNTNVVPYLIIGAAALVFLVVLFFLRKKKDDEE